MTYFMPIDQIYDDAWDRIFVEFNCADGLGCQEEFIDWCDDQQMNILFESNLSRFINGQNIKTKLSKLLIELTQAEFEFSIGPDEGFVFDTVEDFLLFKLTWL